MSKHDLTSCPNCGGTWVEYIGTHVSDEDPPEYTNEWWCPDCAGVFEDHSTQEPECLWCFDTKRAILGVDDRGVAYHGVCTHCRKTDETQTASGRDAGEAGE